MWHIGIVALLVFVAVLVGATISFASTKHRVIGKLRSDLAHEHRKIGQSAEADEGEVSELEREIASTALDQDIAERKLEAALHAAKVDADSAMRVADRALAVLGVNSLVGGELLSELSLHSRIIQGDLGRIVVKVKQAKALAAGRLAEMIAEKQKQKAAEEEERLERLGEGGDDGDGGDGGGGDGQSASTDGVIKAGSTLTSGTQTDTVTQGSVKLIMQTDGNLVLYGADGASLWSSGTFGKGTGPYRATMQPDGNLVLYDSTNSPLWHTETYGKGDAPYRAVVQADSNFVVYDSKNTALWSSGTYM